MSLLAKRIGLIFISALIFFSCNKGKETVGLNLNPQNNGLGTFYIDTFSFKTTAVLKNDSINTSTQGYSYVGAYHDELFGDVFAEAYNQLLLTTENISTVGGATDSVVMNLQFDYHYGDTTNLQTINVSNLSAAIPATSTFSISPALASGANRDTDVSFNLKPVTNQNVKIYLDSSWGNDILNNKNGPGGIGGTGTTNADFIVNFPGIAIKPKETSGSSLGNIIRFKLFDNTSYIKIYFKRGAVRDSLQLLLTSGGVHFSRIIGGASPDPVLSTLGNSGDVANASQQIFVQSGLGIGTKIEFPYLIKLKDSLGNIAINRAELILELNPAKVDPSTYYTPVGAFHLLKLTSSGAVRKYLNPDGNYYDVEVQADMYPANGYGSRFIGYYNVTSYNYTLNISSYIQSLLYGLDENNGFIIAADPIVSNTSVNRTYIDGSKVKLKIYYTQIN